MSEPQSVFGILLRRARNRETPDIRLDADSTGREPPRHHVRFDVGNFAERQLPVAIACATGDSEIENWRIENRTPRRGRIDQANAIRQPGKAPQQLTVR